MGVAKTYTWDSYVIDNICTTQSGDNGDPLNLNGVLASNGIVVFNNFSRTISLTTSDEATDSGISITGSLNGVPVVENLEAGDTTTVFSANIYDTILSLDIIGTATDWQVGTGTSGYLPWIAHDYQSSISNFSVGINVTGAITYNFEATLQNVNPGTTPITFIPFVELSAQTVTNFGFFSSPFQYSRLHITDSDETGSLVYCFLQQGIK